MKNFILIRHTDLSGISGTGIIAEGTRFSNGKCVISWKTTYRSIAIYDDMETMMKIHGHDGHTELQWITLDKHRYIPGEEI